jgi:hypothetical protein
MPEISLVADEPPGLDELHAMDANVRTTGSPSFSDE